jgi:Flp pilus assembly protein CpaB
MLAPPGTRPGLEVRIEEGYRAVSVKIDEVSGVAYNLKPGDWVDVITVMSVMRNGRKDTISNVFLQRVQVAGVGQWLDDPGTKGAKARSVTLLVKDEDVPKLHLAQTKGKVTLAMRGREDERISTYEATSEAAISGGAGDPVPVALTPGNPAESAPAPTPEVVAQVPKEWVVTVFNGPLKTKDTTAVHRVAYDGPASLKVVRTELGRSPGRGDPDTAESIMQYRPASTDRRDRSRGGQDRDTGAEPSRDDSGGEDGSEQ